MVLYMTVPLERDVVHSPNVLIYDFLEVEREARASEGCKLKVWVVSSFRCRPLVQRHNIDGE